MSELHLDIPGVDGGPGMRIAWERLDSEWRIAASVDPSEAGTLRVLSASLEDGSGLMLAGFRPASAKNHGDDRVVAASVTESGEIVEFDRTLWSTEYSEAGAPRRITLELRGAEEPLPLRAAGEVEAVEPETDGAGWKAHLSFRMEGQAGTAKLESTELG